MNTVDDITQGERKDLEYKWNLTFELPYLFSLSITWVSKRKKGQYHSVNFTTLISINTINLKDKTTRNWHSLQMPQTG